MNPFEQLAEAAKNMDWIQVVLNGGPPCFYLENDGFCGRAERWEGHGGLHPFVSLFDLCQKVREQQRQKPCPKCGVKTCLDLGASSLQQSMKELTNNENSTRIPDRTD